MPKCIYCKAVLHDDSVLDVCRPCGLQVWGENMYNAIVGNMEKARDKGDLYQGSVTEQPLKEISSSPKGIQTPPGFNPPSPSQQTPSDLQPPASNFGAGFSLVRDAILQLEETQTQRVESTLNKLQETELLPPAEELVEEMPFIVEASETGF